VAALALQEFEEFDSEAGARRPGNRPAVCRKCYVHPAVLDSYLDGSLVESLRRQAEDELADSISELEPEEAAVLVLLREKLARQDT
jgi:DNA topoisomerase I